MVPAIDRASITRQKACSNLDLLENQHVQQVASEVRVLFTLAAVFIAASAFACLLLALRLQNSDIQHQMRRHLRVQFWLSMTKIRCEK